MAKKRVQHEIKIIIILAVLSVIFFGLTFGIKAITSHQTDAEQELIDKATMTEIPYKVEVVNDTEPFTIEKKDNVWSCDVDPDMPVSSLKVTMMRTVLKYFQPARIIMDAKDKWADFGLDHPQTTVTLTSDEKKNTFMVGDYNPVLDEYYMAMDGEDAVFLVSRANMTDFNLDILGYAGDPSIVGKELTDITSIKVKTGSADYTIDTSSSAYTVNTGIESFAAGQYVPVNILSSFSSSTYRCVAHKATEADLKEYGLDDPDIQVTYTDKEGKEYRMQASQAEDGRCYAREDGTGLVYQIEEKTYNSLVERTKTENLRG